MIPGIHKKILSPLSGEEKRKFYYAVLLDVVVALLDLAFLAGLLFLVNQYLSGGAGFLGTDFLKEHPLTVFGIFFGAYALKNALAWWVLRRQQDYFYSVATRLSENRLRHYLQSDYEAYVQVDSSVYSRQIGQQPVEYAHYVLRGWHQVIGQSLLVLMTILVILFYDASLFLMLFALLSLPVALTAFWLRRRLSKTREAIQQSSESSLQHLQESLAGFIESKIFSKKEFFIRRYTQYQKKLNHNLAGLQSMQSLPSRLIELFALAGFFVLLSFSVYQDGGALNLVTLGAFLAAAYKIIPGMVKVLNGMGQIRAYEFVLKDLEGVQQAGVKPEENGKPLHLEMLSFEQVSFSYGDRKVFRDLNFTIRSGELAGLSGVSGKGKTTLVHLLLRFLKPDGGSILINGKPADQWPQEAIWERVSYVRQQPFFLHDSVYQNVVMGEEGINEDRFSQAVDTTGFYTFTTDTSKLVRENGRNISGGQRQRIALARALYKDADLLILDEPFSELDGPSVRNILNELKTLAASGKMILLITHDADTLSHCSKIIHLENC